MKLNPKQRLEIGAYIVTIALAIPSYVFALLVKNSSFQDLLINLSATFAGAGFLFFLLNRFFGLDNDLSNIIETSLRRITATKSILATNDEWPLLFPKKDILNIAEKVDVLGITPIDFLQYYREVIIKRVQVGTIVRLILIDPTSKASATFREVWEYSTFDTDFQRSLGLIHEIQDAIKKSGKSKGKFEIRLLAWIPSCTMIIVDSHLSTGKAKVAVNNPNYSTSTASRPHIILNKNNDPYWYTYYNDEFEKLWNQAKSESKLTQ
jgi:hypothetical protein